MIPENEYASYYKQYINLIESNKKTIVENLIDTQKEFNMVLKNVAKEKHNFSYAKGKWTLKEVVQHIIDTERVFSYRALCFARNDKTELPGFDQDLFVENDNANDRDFNDLLEEMDVVRKGSILLYKSFTEDALLKIGIGSGNNMSVRALGLLFSGHQQHHLNVIKERYL